VFLGGISRSRQKRDILVGTWNVRSLYLVGKPEGKRPLGRIILRGIFRKWEGVVGTGWSGLRIGTGGGHL
jgi:hypothetical protein